MPIVQVRRRGTARVLRAAIDGVQLAWQPADQHDQDRSVSKPKDLPAGRHVLTWFARGKKDTTYGFAIIQPTGTPCFIGPKTFASDGFDVGECRFDL